MSAILADVDTASSPPTTVPFQHFAVAAVFLVAGVVLGGVNELVSGLVLVHLAQVHALFVGFVCLTIMGAMSQFVPVWSSVDLHSKRLARVALALVAVGVAGLVTGFSLADFRVLAAGGGTALVGFWVFAYNVARTLATARPFDPVERHFAWALGFLLAATLLGFSLALDFLTPTLAPVGLARGNVVLAHATLAVFGVVLTTVFGAFGQLSRMFTQTGRTTVGRRLGHVEEVTHVLGTVTFAAGRLAGVEWVAVLGGLGIVVATLAFAAATTHRFYAMRVPWSPVLTRYALAVASMGVWALAAGYAWVTTPLSRAALFGPRGSLVLFALGVVGFVVFGTLYHVVPFIVWVERYSDDLGRRRVPMLDDLYRDDVAAADLVALVLGGGILLASAVFDGGSAVTSAGGLLVAVGVALFVANLASTVRTHGGGLVVALSEGVGAAESAE